MHHPQVVQSQIVNDCLKVKIDCHTEPQLDPKLLLQVTDKELHNNLVSDIGNSERNVESLIMILSSSSLDSLSPPYIVALTRFL